MTWTPGSPTEATPITLSAVVQNTGNAAAPATTLNFGLGGTTSVTAPAFAAGAQAPGPDLQVLNITHSPANPAVGAAVAFTVAVHNRGTTATGTTTVTRVTVGSTTLNTNTASIAARATVNVAIAGGWTATNATISLYINGVFDRKLTLSSRHSWL